MRVAKMLRSSQYFDSVLRLVSLDNFSQRQPIVAKPSIYVMIHSSHWVYRLKIAGISNFENVFDLIEVSLRQRLNVFFEKAHAVVRTIDAEYKQHRIANDLINLGHCKFIFSFD